MTGAFAKVVSYLLIIVLGYALRRLRLFRAKHTEVISKIIFNITLPCVIIISFSSIEMSGAFLALIAAGFVYNLFMLALGAIIARRAPDRDSGIMYGLFVPSQNIGIFGIPVAQACFSPAVVAALCLFDIGNATVMFGPSFVMASARADGGRATARYVIKKLFSSVPFVTYLVVISMELLKIAMPLPVLTFAQICGAGNSFLAMLLIGIMLEPRIERPHRLIIARITLIRLAAAALFAVPAWFMLSLPTDIKIAIVIALSMSTAAASAVHAASLGVNKALISGLSAVSMFIGAGLVLILSVVLV